MKCHATVLRAFTHADDSFEPKQVILGMDPGQFADWSAPGVDLVREATPAEIATARGDKPAPAKKPARRRGSATKVAARATEVVTPPAPAAAASDA